VAWFMVAVGGCCGFADSAAAADAAVLESAAPMAAVGGCCPVVVPVAPAVGPDPASFDASSLVTFSISAVHGPAAGVATGKATTAQAPSSNVIVFMRVSPDERILSLQIQRSKRTDVPFPQKADAKEQGVDCVFSAGACLVWHLTSEDARGSSEGAPSRQAREVRW